jgi:hypothetical protein
LLTAVCRCHLQYHHFPLSRPHHRHQQLIKVASARKILKNSLRLILNGTFRCAKYILRSQLFPAILIKRILFKLKILESGYDYTELRLLLPLLLLLFFAYTEKDMPCSYGIYFYFSLYTPEEKKNPSPYPKKGGKTRAVRKIRIARKRIIFLYFFISQSNVPSSFLKAVSQFQRSPSFFTLP